MRPLLIAEGDRQREHRDAMDEVGGAIDGIDDPAGAGVDRMAARTALLAEDAMIGVVGADAQDERVLDQAVDVADVVAVALGAHILLHHAGEMLACDPPSGPGQLDDEGAHAGHGPMVAGR